MGGLWHEIKEAVGGHGHSCNCDDCMEEHHHHGEADRVMLWRLLAAALLFVGGLVLEKIQGTASLVLFILSVLCAGYDVFVGAAANLLHRRLFDESLLMSVVAIAAIVIGEAEEGASVMILFQLGELFQGYAVARVRRSIEGLMENRLDGAAEVLRGVRANQTGKGTTEEFITKFSRIYTPVVLGIAVVVAVLCPLVFHQTVLDGVYRALVLMVIACPCAIVISVPLSYFAGIGGAAKLGILFKNTGAMDAVSRTHAVIFEKNGVLESGSLRLSSIKCERMDADVFLRIAAHTCAYSAGERAECIKAAYDGVIYIELVEAFEEEPGNGIAVRVDGVNIVLGNAVYVAAHGIDPGADLCQEDAAYLGIDGVYSGRILFARALKPDAQGTVTVLSWDTDKEVALLTDESAAATAAFASQFGVGRCYPASQPSDKIAVVRDMRSRCRKGTLLFVGDPVEDADCLKEADIGVALNGADSDAAIAAADVVVMDDSPSKVVTAIEAARHTHHIVWQNIAFALGFKVVILVLDLFGVCPLWLAVFADVGVALLAVLNSLRAFRVKNSIVPSN